EVMTRRARGRPSLSSRQRPLEAAMHEFAARGPAGARVEAIGRRAGVNKQLITYYFGGKEGLYRETLRWCFARPTELPPGPVAGLLADFFRAVLANPETSRLLQWEALGGEPADDEVRIRRLRSLVEHVAAEQHAGRVAADYEPDLLALSLLAT